MDSNDALSRCRCRERRLKKYDEKQFSIRRMEFLHPAMWHDHDIDFARRLHSAVLHVAVESWQWIHQVATPCNVIRGSRMTCYWNRPLAAPRNVTRSCGIMALNTPGGSTLQCGRWLWDDRPLNSPKRLPYWNSACGFDLDHITAVDVILQQSGKFHPIGPPSAEKMTSCRFSRWRISAILDFMGPIMDSLKSPCTTSYRSSIDTMALNCLVFLENRVFAIWPATDRQTYRHTDRRTDGHARRMKPLSLLRWVAELRYLEVFILSSVRSIMPNALSLVRLTAYLENCWIWPLRLWF